MNPFDLTVSELLIWGLVLHLIADWPLQNDWMAKHKTQRHMTFITRADCGCVSISDFGHWWRRHPAAYVHAGIHGVLLAIVFGWVAIFLAIAHLIIDTRWPVELWSKLIRQTQPITPVWAFRDGWEGRRAQLRSNPITRPLEDHNSGASGGNRESQGMVVDVGLEVRFWTDQTFHITCIAIAALVVGT